MAAEAEIEVFFEKAGSVLAGFVEAVAADGKLADAGLRGADEMSRALIAFPESIQSQMPNGLWGPGNDASIPSPGEIADGKAALPPEPAVGMDQDRGLGM